MLTNKILHINECYFSLPDNFHGTLGEALLLLANRCLQAEAYDEVHKSEWNPDINLSELLRNSDHSKCCMSWELIEGVINE